jgi:hypothetical protein
MIMLLVYILKFASLMNMCIIIVLNKILGFHNCMNLCCGLQTGRHRHHISLRLYQLTRYVLSAHETNMCVWNTGVF